LDADNKLTKEFYCEVCEKRVVKDALDQMTKKEILEKYPLLSNERFDLI